ncbi:PREDICTED: probable ATP-dependent RNA helicase DDX52 [Nicrophorus vespilloides]|uniref:Probable ATP-dependent RNA helicase DDX52 n=1 Tax=Nicrophorus vespilloides TaxID=110193 RepID=A0ABM1NES0_NICVS|nr:PREDICTED: probable ATP-dependent RNA helicase DDX52 [Nicrophorus vespilloides]
MDAEDIFKKFSRGAKFTKRKLPKVSLQPLKVDKEVTIPIKQEYKEILKEDSENEDTTLTLLGNMTTTQTKGKKRKATSVLEAERKSKLLVQESENQFRNELQISVHGKDIPAAAKSFEDLDINQDLKKNFEKCGYKEPTPVQKQAIPIMLKNRQILGCAPTGSGKTAAFLVPIIETLKGPEKVGVRALILSPTRELAKQTVNECMRLSEGRSLRVQLITKATEDKFKKCDILVTTPNRLCYLLKSDPPAISLSFVEWVVVDEADKFFEEVGRSFKDQLDEILMACTNSNRKIAMFSATYTPAVAKWSLKNMDGVIRMLVGAKNSATDLVDQKLLFVGSEAGKMIEFRNMIHKGFTPPVLVFVQSKERAKQLFSELVYDGINVDAIHADRTETQRQNTVRSFREGKIWVLICTELMARGIDFKGVNLVINYDFPPSSISYVHRVGRAGRAGRKGEAVTYFTLDDTVNLKSIAHVIKQSGCEIPDYMNKLKKHKKNEKKMLMRRAPNRDDILTMPYDDRLRIDRKMGKERMKHTLKHVEAKEKKEHEKEEAMKAKKKNGDGEKKKHAKKPEHNKKPMKKVRDRNLTKKKKFTKKGK